MRAGPVYKYDLSLPVEKMYSLVEEMRARLGEKRQHYLLNFELLDIHFVR